jgi:hypothetical protein
MDQIALDHSEGRLVQIRTFYSLLSGLEERMGGMRRLSECTGRMLWPRRGVYFFFEDGEERSASGDGPRVVRVGTHALTSGSSTTLWRRLSQHRGSRRSGGGNHRGSVFRLIAGAALLNRDGESAGDSWGRGSKAGADVRARERDHEKRVSAYLGSMRLLWIDIGDDPGRESLRGVVERNSIALLSNFGRTPVDDPSPNWLGHFSDRERVRRSGLWNQNHVEEDHDPAFLNTLQRLIFSAAGST